MDVWRHAFLSIFFRWSTPATCAHAQRRTSNVSDDCPSWQHAARRTSAPFTHPGNMPHAQRATRPMLNASMRFVPPSDALQVQHAVQHAVQHVVLVGQACSNAVRLWDGWIDAYDEAYRCALRLIPSSTPIRGSTPATQSATPITASSALPIPHLQSRTCAQRSSCFVSSARTPALVTSSCHARCRSQQRPPLQQAHAAPRPPAPPPTAEPHRAPSRPLVPVGVPAAHSVAPPPPPAAPPPPSSNVATVASAVAAASCRASDAHTPVSSSSSRRLDADSAP
eukprot:360872-Chlamydomonas_euryale.AAC.2